MSKLETKSRPSQPTNAKTPVAKPKVVPKAETKGALTGLTTQEKINKLRMEERNARYPDPEDEVALNEPLDIAVDDHGARFNQIKKSLRYVASKGDLGELEAWCDADPFFNEALPYTGPLDVDDERKKLVNDALLWAAERSHLSNLRWIVQNHASDIDWARTSREHGGKTVAQAAYYVGQTDAVLFLLRNGCPLHTPGPNGLTLLTIKPIQALVNTGGLHTEVWPVPSARL